MRWTFAGLNTMVRGINANQLSLNTVGHNISNASSTGYSRQSVNLAATRSDEVSSLYGNAMVGSGVSSTSIVRARSVYADKQYWQEYAYKSYYETRQTNYSKIETFFNDSDENGIQNALEKFYASWTELSANASAASARTAVIEHGRVFSERLNAAADQLQQQITNNYEDIRLNVNQINETIDQIVRLNKSINASEVTGASANDLRDQRDNLTDTLAGFLNINVYEDDSGMYSIVCEGMSLVNGIASLHFEMSDGLESSKYGVTDYAIMVKETNTVFTSSGGSIRGEFDAINEQKEYIDRIANMAGFMLTQLNHQHKAGVDINGNAGGNFYGTDGETYATDTTDPANIGVQRVNNGDTLYGIQIVREMTVNPKLIEANGQNLLAAAAPGNDTGDGENATLVSNLFNTPSKSFEGSFESGSSSAAYAFIGTFGLNNYYSSMMTDLGVRAQAMNDKVDRQSEVVLQIENWRSSVSSVNWNEELSNMIRFQQGFSACSRCLNAMDEILDRLVNSTGLVGR